MHEDCRRALQICNVGFSALLCILFGLILVLGSLSLVQAKPIAFLASGLVGAITTVLIYRRIAGHWQAGVAFECGIRKDAVGKLRRPSFLLALLFLGSTGYIGAIVAGTGWATPVILYALFLFLFPWYRVAICKTSPALSLSVLSAGLITGLVTTDWLPHLLLIGVTVWILWTAALLAWLTLIFLDRQQLRATSAVSRHATDKPENTPDALQKSSIH